MSEIDPFIDRLRAVARERGATLESGEGVDDDAQAEAFGQLEAETGDVVFVPPPSYAELLRRFGWLRLVGDDDSLLDIPTLDELVEEQDAIYIPSGVSWETVDGKEIPIATHHLVPFARAPHDSYYCFDTSSGIDYSVVIHNQDEPVHARDARTFNKPDLGPAPRAASTFLDWLEKITAALEAGRASLE